MIKKQKSSIYTSCIRINGKPILPPLITPNKKEQLQGYKRKALEVEEKLKARLSTKTSDAEIQSCSNTTLEHQLSFSDNCNIIFENNDVPCSNRESVNLTCDVVEVSEYSDSGIRLFSDKTNVDYCSSLLSEKKDSGSSSLNEDPEVKPAPLIRSNSYTLESPSPVLLAHLMNMSLESDFAPVDYIKLSEERETVPSEGDKTGQESNSSICDEGTEKITEGALTNSVKNSTEITNPLDVRDKSESTDTTEIDAELQTILTKLSSNDKEQILLLLKLQEQGQVHLESIITPTTSEFNSPSCIDSCSQTVYLPFEDTQSVLTENSELKIDLLETPSSRINMDNFVPEKLVCSTVVRNILNCSKQLLSEDDIWLQQRLREDWAASIIGAHIRGYLTRRLMATERVRALIETIKDALICAVQLHAETTENINESDVELHRRLLQQISAACYAFHDIFFSLSITEQMAIIAHDRMRLKEKTLKSLGSA